LTSVTFLVCDYRPGPGVLISSFSMIDRFVNGEGAALFYWKLLSSVSLPKRDVSSVYSTDGGLGIAFCFLMAWISVFIIFSASSKLSTLGSLSLAPEDSS